MLNMNEIQKLKNSLENRNIEFSYFENNEELVRAILAETLSYKSIGIGNSQTLKKLKISETILENGKQVYDKTLVSTKDDIRKLKKLALTSDCYISSCNALSLDGKIVNVDHSGNRVAAITFGPERVLIVVGVNKIVNNEKEAIERALLVATPKNAIRAGIKPPCSHGGSCSECTQEERVCNYVSVIRGQHNAGRMKIMLLNKELGY